MYLFIFTVTFAILGFLYFSDKFLFFHQDYRRLTEHDKALVNKKMLKTISSIYMFSISFSFALMAIGEHYDIQWLIILGILLIVLLSFPFAILSEKAFTEVHKNKSKFKRSIPIIILSVTFVFVCLLLFFAVKDSVITLNKNTLTIEGIYGLDIPVKDIESVELVHALPEKLIKVNGSAISGKYKGHFKSSKGSYVLFVDDAIQTFVRITYNDKTYIFNTLDDKQTANLFYKISAKKNEQ